MESVKIEHLPEHVLEQIFWNLDVKSLKNVAKTCKT